MIDTFIIAAYLSLALELLVIPVPSVASAVQLARRARTQVDGAGAFLAGLRWYAPAVLNIVIFLLPLTQALVALVRGGNAQTPTLPTFAGIALVLLGRSLTVASALSLRSQSRLRLARGELHAPLSDRGVFRFSRNPGLVGMYLFTLGLLCLKPSLWFALGLLHYVWHMHQRVRIEEQHLQQRLGEGYRIYARSTRRYV